jgi:spore germination protein GerM
LAASTNVRAVFLTPEGTAYVDLSNDLLRNISPGIETEFLSVYSVVNSITTNIPSVKRVKILIQGQEVDTLEGHADLTDAIVPDPTLIQSGP